MPIFPVVDQTTLLRVDASVDEKPVTLPLDTGSFDVLFSSGAGVCTFDSDNATKTERYGSLTVRASPLSEEYEMCDPHNDCVTIGRSGRVFCADMGRATGGPIEGTEEKQLQAEQRLLHDGLIGIAKPNAFADDTMTFIYNRPEQTVCIGPSPDRCTNRDTSQSVRTGHMNVPRVVDGMILDTGSTATQSLGKEMQAHLGASCLVGIRNIDYLELDMFENTAAYRLRNEQQVNAACPELMSHPPTPAAQFNEWGANIF